MLYLLYVRFSEKCGAGGIIADVIGYHLYPVRGALQRLLGGALLAAAG